MSIYKRVSTLLTLVCALYMCFVSLLQFSIQPGQKQDRITKALPGYASEQGTFNELQHWDPAGNIPGNQVKEGDLASSHSSGHVTPAANTQYRRDGLPWRREGGARTPAEKIGVVRPQSVRLRKLSEKSRAFTSSHFARHDHRKESGNPRVRQFVIGNQQQLVSESKVDFLSLGEDFYVYGAFLDTRYPPSTYARLLTLRPSVNHTAKLLCRYFDFFNRTIDVIAEPYEMCENHDRKYGGWIYSCELLGFVPSTPIVISLSLIPKSRQAVGGFTTVQLHPVAHNISRHHGTKSPSLRGRDQPHEHLRQTDLTVPAVHISKSHSTGGSITVQHKDTHQNTTRDNSTKAIKIGVCVPPLYGDVYLSKVINFIEMSRLLGAHKIFLYIHDISEELLSFLRHYTGLDPSILSLVDWDLPVLQKSSSSSSSAPSSSSSSSSPSSPSFIASQIIWNKGQLMAVQHCLYNNMADYDWLLFIDTDEMLVPQTAVTWPELVTQITNQFHKEFHHSRTAGISFESAFFQQDFQTLVTNSIEYFQYLHRTLETSSKRSKLLVQPSRVFELGIHHLSKPVKENLTVIQASTGQGLLHHYRKCVANEGDDDIRCEILVKDETILRYEVPLTIASREVTKAAMDFLANQR